MGKEEREEARGIKERGCLFVILGVSKQRAPPKSAICVNWGVGGGELTKQKGR